MLTGSPVRPEEANSAKNSNVKGKGKAQGKGRGERDRSRDFSTTPKPKGICHVYVRHGQVFE